MHNESDKSSNKTITALTKNPSVIIILLLLLGLSILMFWNLAMINYDDGLTRQNLIWALGFFFGGLFPAVTFLEIVNWFNIKWLINKKKKIAERLKTLPDKIANVIAWLIGFSILAGIGYLVFGFIGSLSVSTLLIIIIIILLFK